MKSRRAGWGAWAGGAMAAAALLVSAYFWWWRPFVIATLRFGLERALADVRPRVTFREVDLRGLRTLVVRDVAAGSLEDPTSVAAREVRITFSLRELWRGRFDFVAALGSVTLVRPQAVVPWPPPVVPAPHAAWPIPPHAVLAIEDGRLLLRQSGPPPKRGHPPSAPVVLTLTDIDASIAPQPDGGHALSWRCTTPESPRRGLSVSGRRGPTSLTVAIDLDRIRWTPLAPWLAPLKLPVQFPAGDLSADLTLAFTRSVAGGHWQPASANGTLSARGLTVSSTGLPRPLTAVTGKARLGGNRASFDRVAVTTWGAAWTVGGTVTLWPRPALAFTGHSAAAELGAVDADSRGSGPCDATLTGPVDDLTLVVRPTLGAGAWWGATFSSMAGTFTLNGGGRQLTLEGVTAALPAGQLTLEGQVPLPGGNGRLDWTLTPRDPLLPKLSGRAATNPDHIASDVATSDGLWKARVNAALRGGVWQVTGSGRTTAGARLDLAGSVGAAAPHRLGGTLAMTRAPLSALYLDRRHAMLGRMNLSLKAAGTLGGTLDEPVVAANLAGSTLALAKASSPVSGTLKLSRRAVELAPVRLSPGVEVRLLWPFGEGTAAATVVGEGLPLALLRDAFDLPAWAGTVDGAFHGRIEATDLAGQPAFTGGGELRSLVWRGEKLGMVTFTLDQRGAVTRLNGVKLRGAPCSADGGGTFEQTKAGWDATGRFTVGYLKAGKAVFDGQAELTATRDRTAQSAECRLTAVRIDGAAYPDAEGRVTWKDAGRITASLSWEDVCSLVFEGSPTGEGPVALTGAFTELPLAPLVAAAGLSAPAEKLSGTLSLKGPADHAALAMSLRWPRGDCSARGWMTWPGAKAAQAMALTVSGSDHGIAPWVPLLRTIPAFRALPDVDGAFETRSFAFERNAVGAIKADGWLRIKDLKVRAQTIGDGSLRVKLDKDAADVEGSVEGEGGAFTLHPTKWRRVGQESTLEGAFAWGKVPAGRAVCACSRGTIFAKFKGERGGGTLLLSGLALNDLSTADVSVGFEAAGGRWRLTSPRESAWSVLGTVVVTGARVAIEEDERCEGAFVLLRGPAGASLKLAGAWPLPDAPERLLLEGHRIAVAPILVVLGASPMDGLAECDLKWKAADTPPLTGRLTILKGQWGEFPFDVFEVRGQGAPGRSFSFTGIRLERAGELQARGTGSITFFPEKRLDLSLSVEKLGLGYLRPFGFVDRSDCVGLGRLTVTGDPDDPDVNGSLVITSGTFTPPTGFTDLRLADGRVDFRGHEAVLTATLNDVTGAAVIVGGQASFQRLVPKSFSLVMTAPVPIRVDGIPRLYKGEAKGRITYDGSPDAPGIHGDITVSNGRLQTPPKKKRNAPPEFADRVDWDLRVKFGSGLTYAVEPLGGAALDVAQLSTRSHLHVKGKGEAFQVFGEVFADSGPVTYILGKQLYSRDAP